MTVSTTNELLVTNKLLVTNEIEQTNELLQPVVSTGNYLVQVDGVSKFLLTAGGAILLA